MYNTNSPIINNMQGMTFGGQAYGGPPPNPMGNIVNIGNVGYYGSSSGYYNGNYGARYIDPYSYRREQEAMIAQQHEAMRGQSDIFKSISKAVHKSSGNEVSEEYLNKVYDPQFEQQQKMDEDEYSYNQLTSMQLQGREFVGNPYAIQETLYRNAYVEQQKKRFPDDISVSEFHERGYELILDALNDKRYAEEKNLGNLYNKDEYNKLINMHSKSAKYFNSLMQIHEANGMGGSIDDITVSMPNAMATEVQRRKSAFLASMLEGR